MIKLILCGCNGQMGKVIASQVDEMDGFEIVAGMDMTNDNSFEFPVFEDINDFSGHADALIDFSNPSTLPKLLKYSIEKDLPLVLSSTGYSKEEVKDIDEASKKAAILYSGNMSLGINILLSLVKKAASVGITVYMLSDYYYNQGKTPAIEKIILGYAGIPEADLPKAVKLLAHAWEL